MQLEFSLESSGVRCVDFAQHSPQKEKRGRPAGLPRFCGWFEETAGKSLEAETNAQFDRTRRVELRAFDAPSRGIGEAEDWVTKLVVVEDVGKDGLEFSAEA